MTPISRPGNDAALPATSATNATSLANATDHALTAPMAVNGAMSSAAEAKLPPAGSGVVDANGEFGTVVSHHALDGAGGLSEMVVVRHREQQVLLPAGLFDAISPTSFRIPLAFAALMHSGGQNGNVIIPVLQEEMTVGTRLVDSGRGVRIHKTVVETPQAIERDLLQDRLTVEHVAIGRLLDEDESPQPRQEGDLLIVPVIEEVLVVQVRRRLKEEIRVMRSSELVRQRQMVTLRSEQVQVERFDESAKADDARRTGIPSTGAGMTEAGTAGGLAASRGATSPATAHTPSPLFADDDGVLAGAVGTVSPAPDAFGAASHPGSPGATQRDVSAGTRLSS